VTIDTFYGACCRSIDCTTIEYLTWRRYQMEHVDVDIASEIMQSEIL
jgi:hypothetical protein